MSKKEKWLLVCLVATLMASVVYDATVMMDQDKEKSDSESLIACPHDRGFEGTVCQENNDG